MAERYTPDQLSRMSEDDVIRKEYDERNLQSLVWLLLLFGVLRTLELVARGFEAELTTGQFGALMSIIDFNLWAMFFVIAARKWPRLRRGVTGWVIAFCIIQFFAYALTPTETEPMWVYASFFTLLYARFLLAPSRTAALFSFLLAATIALAIVRGAPRPASEGTSSVALVLAYLGLSMIFLSLASAMQIRRAKRVRQEILDEWREPLHNAREQVRMRDELQYARQMQLAMLPEAPPRLDWIDIAATSIPAAEVGGDYYDFFSHEGRLSIVACDVAGHGLKSGLVLAAMRGGLITTLRRSLSKPAAVLEQLHDLVSHTSRERMLAAAVVVMLDRAAGTAIVASAGHPPVILRRGSTVSTIDIPAPPLGVRLRFAIEERSFPIAPGDVLVLHSDGVYESRDAAGESYGLERLQQTVGRHPLEGSAESLRDAILKDVSSFRGAAPQDDDVTVVVARITA
jgi:hypothetical protein